MAQRGSKGPRWVNVLIAAEEWGCPPWVIAGGNHLKWYLRWEKYKSILAWENERKNKKSKR